MEEKELKTIKRDKLYEEIWQISVAGVAKKYDLPYAKLLQLCKKHNVPIAPSGYWTKLNFGKEVEKIPLPPSDVIDIELPNDDIVDTISLKKEQEKTKNQESIISEGNIFEGKESEKLQIKKKSTVNRNILKFLDEEERNRILELAFEIILCENEKKMHKAIVNHKSKILLWEKNSKNQAYTPNNAKPQSPYLYDTVSESALTRVLNILNALFLSVEKLGGVINEDLSMQIRGETVYIDIGEGQDEVPHVLTKQEAMEMLVYNDAIKHNRWASKPNIRKYDRLYNGILRFSIRKGRYLRDTNVQQMEQRIGDLLIEAYEESEIVRIHRIISEEKERKRAEEERIREEKKELYNNEIKRTNALINISEDYDIACKIRNLINGMKLARDLDEDEKEWIEWAQKKADWYDPAISREDECFGIRKHHKSAESKVFRERGYWW